MSSSAKGKAYTAGWYRDNEIHLAFWKGNEKWVNRIPFKWYFYLSTKQFRKVSIRKYIERIADYVEKSESGKYIRVYADWFERRNIYEAMIERNIIPLEVDVTPLDRFIADNGIEFDPNPKVLFYDIETVAKSWDDLSTHRILSIAYRGPDMDKTEFLHAPTDNVRGEHVLLDKFCDVIAKHDVLAAWNGDFYDEQVLKARCKKGEFEPAWEQIRFLDTMALFKKYFMRDESGEGVRTSFALNNIAKTVLGKGKIEDLPPNKIHWAFNNNLELLEQYNVRDVDLMVELEEKFRFGQAHTILSHLCNRFFQSRCLKQGYVTDGFVLRYGSNVDFRFPTKFHDANEHYPKIEGAHVEDPEIGFHEGVCDLDLKSLYPNIVMAWNISPETRLAELDESRAGRSKAFIESLPKLDKKDLAVAANGAQFRTDHEGIFPAVSRIAVDERQQYYNQAKMLESMGKEGTPEHRIALQTSNVYKVLANAFFGQMSSGYTRYYDPICGEAITVTGKASLNRIKHHANEKGIRMIYGDTDSAFVKCTESVADEFAKSCNKVLNQHANERGAKGRFQLKTDAVFTRIFFTSKKRYAGKKSTGAIDIRGLEVVRSDQCKAARDLQKRMIDFILEAQNPTAEKAKRIIRKWSLRVHGGELEADDLMLSQSLSRSFQEYKADVLHVRIAKEMMNRGEEVYIGMKIPYVIVGLDDQGRLKAVHKDKFNGEYAKELYWKRIYPATKRVLDAVFSDAQRDWRYLETWNPYAKQQDIFDSVPNHKDPVEFKLTEADHDHLSKLKEIVDQYPGERKLFLNLALSDATVKLLSGCRVSLKPELIKQVEAIVGRRVYFGAEKWD